MHEWGLSEELKIQTKQMIEIAEKELSIMRNAIDKEDECILCKMEDIHHMLANVQTLALHTIFRHIYHLIRKVHLLLRQLSNT